MPDTGCSILDTGYWALDTGYGGTEFKIDGCESIQMILCAPIKEPCSLALTHSPETSTYSAYQKYFLLRSVVISFLVVNNIYGLESNTLNILSRPEIFVNTIK